MVVVGVLLASVSGAFFRWLHNHNQPVLHVDSIVKSRRTAVSQHHDPESHAHHSSTTYYLTFEVESGSRMEFQVQGSEYGQLAEGDEGKLTFQGTRYLGFQRVSRMAEEYERRYDDIYRST
nr:DUF2500 domain-containing protein [Paenibacillus shirakamiensis]